MKRRSKRTRGGEALGGVGIGGDVEVEARYRPGPVRAWLSACLAIDVANCRASDSRQFHLDMAALQKLSRLSGPHCVLLAVHYATHANVPALQALTALRDGDLPLELSLSILLHYLPEEHDPAAYYDYLAGLATGSPAPGDSPADVLDVAPVEQLSDARAKKRRHTLALPPVIHPLYAAASDIDLFTHFLIHRSHRIDTQTGLLDLVPRLVVPFLDHSEYLRTWFISTALPLLRLSYEYYPQLPAPTLDEFAALTGQRAIHLQLSNVLNASGDNIHNVARDLKGVVAPWLCGAHDRKQRSPTNQVLSGSVDDGRTNCCARPRTTSLWSQQPFLSGMDPKIWI